MMNAAMDVHGVELSSERENTDYIERMRVPLGSMEHSDPEMFELLRYWQSLRRGSLLPSRDQIDPLHFKRFLGRIHLVDTANAPPENYFFRLWGSLIRFDGGADYGKLRIGDYPRAFWRRAVMQDYADAVKMGVPAYHHVAAQNNWVGYRYSRLILPLSANRRVVTELLVHIDQKPATMAANA